MDSPAPPTPPAPKLPPQQTLDPASLTDADIETLVKHHADRLRTEMRTAREFARIRRREEKKSGDRPARKR